MLTELCAEIKNYFLVKIHYGSFEIDSEGTIDLGDKLQNGQYFRIVGSVFNDGVYQYPVTELKPEIFDGAIWAMAVPPSVIALASEIESWCEKNKETMDSPYASESFGGYSYSKASGADGTYGWKDHFASKLNIYRRIHV